MTVKLFSKIQAVVAAGLVLVTSASPQTAIKAEPSSQDKQAVTDFEKRVNDYLALRKKDAGTSPKPTTSAKKLEQTEKELAAKVRAARSGAKQGDIFTPPIAQYFHRQLEKTLQGPQGAKIRASLKHAEPLHGIAIQVNGIYPPKVPLQSTTPSLLANLPPLPKEIEYRIVNDDLVLHDIAANIIVDFLPHAIPGA